jgi:uridine phosphorylase
MDKPPILDFDPDPDAILSPAKRLEAGRLPERCVLTYFPEALDALCQREKATLLLELESIGIKHRVWGIERQGRRIALFLSGVGSALAGGFLDELIASGVRKALVCGGAGVLDSAISQGHLLLPTSAVREDGLSYHYLPPDAEAKPGAQALAALEQELKSRRVPYMEGKTWTTDGLYRETKAKVAKRRAEGCLSVEMEAAGLFAVAQFRGIQLAQLLYGGDDVSGEKWDHRGWDQNLGVREMMLELCLEAVLKL